MHLKGLIVVQLPSEQQDYKKGQNMIGVTKFNTKTNVGHFYSDTVAELADLPNLTTRGKDTLAYLGMVNVGSTADCFEDKKTYILTGNNRYEAFMSNDSSFEEEDEDIDFSSWSV